MYKNVKNAIIEKVIKEAPINKFAGFPSILLSLSTDEKKSISRRYEVGPKSEQSEITAEQATKKPWSESLLIYTTSVLSDKEQRNARREVEDAMNNFSNTPDYAKLHGSAAGREMYDAKKAEVLAQVSEKYKPKERAVAWGIGTYFVVNREMFSYNYHGRGRAQSDAPNSRKSLIEYIKRYGGKVYYISKDPDVAATMRSRQKSYTSEEQKNIQNRAVAYAKAKKQQLDPIVDQYIATQKAVFGKNLDLLAEKIKTGELYSSSDISKVIFTGIDTAAIGNLGHVYWQTKSWMAHIDSKDSLLRFMKDVNEVIDKLTKQPKPAAKAITV